MQLTSATDPTVNAGTATIDRKMKNAPFYLAFAAILAFGLWLRLDQFLNQTLIDDEWHAIHQIVLSAPSKFMLSFGTADYSIPLTLWFWLQATCFGLSEFSMRLPMMIAGVATIAMFPLAMRGKLNDRVILVFALLIAFSPLLIAYSRMSRPYAITLFLSFVAYWCLDKAVEKNNVLSRSALAYALISTLVLWMHPITGPFLIAPLISLWWHRSVRKETSKKVADQSFYPLIFLSLITSILFSLAVLPPLLGDPAALTGKSGVHSIKWATLAGVWFAWLGTNSLVVVLMAVAFAIVGATSIWQANTIFRWALLGISLTFLLILVSRPAWIFHPLTFGRYLLPAIPVLLLLISAGLIRCIDFGISKIKPDPSNRLQQALLRALYVAVPLGLLIAYWFTSPLPNQISYPNSNTLHLAEQFDYREADNKVSAYINTLPVSPFWASLRNSSPGSIKIAVAPFRFESFDWPAPIWESVSKQKVIPAFLSGSCVGWAHGEVPLDERFKFRNAVHVADAAAIAHANINYMVFFKATRFSSPSPLREIMPQCESWLRNQRGSPTFEDESLIVWKIS